MDRNSSEIWSSWSPDALPSSTNYLPETRPPQRPKGQSYFLPTPSIKKNTPPKIGHILPKSSPYEFSNPIFGDFVSGVTQITAKSGYSTFFKYLDYENEERLCEELRADKSVEGIIVQNPTTHDNRIKLLTEMGMPFVVHGRSAQIKTPYSWVDIDGKKAFENATDYLIQLNHRRIALINDYEHIDFALRRLEGYLTALRLANLIADPALRFSLRMTEYNGYAAMTRMLSLRYPPTAVLVSSMVTAVGVRRAIEDAGLIMGKDVSVITHDDALSHMIDTSSQGPIFTRSRSPIRQTGAIVAKLLLGQIDDGNRNIATWLLDTTLELGRSTGPAIA